ncbi:MAG TPA: LysR substrate-binding domain-containing protein [Chthoniobacterales bacterium]|nr:LysR substrate-binding domain-containing protein [Chthoniobacterales bacterium]
MEMRQLRYFAAVARTGSFSRAARECHVAQPSLSQQIIKLEEEVGERLFERTQRKALLTPAGSLLLPHAVSILEAARVGQQEIREMGGQLRGKILLGALPTIAPYFLPEIIYSFRKKYPAVDLTLHEDTTQQLLRALEENELDLAVISEAHRNPRIEVQQLFSEELFLCLPTGHPLAQRKQVSAANLRNEKFILMQDGHCLGDQTQQFCHNSGFQPEISCRSVQISTVLAMIKAGLGISLIPEMASPLSEKEGIVSRSLHGLRPRREIALALSRERKPSLCVLELTKFVQDRRLQV